MRTRFAPAVLTALLAAGPAAATSIRYTPIPERVARADAVLVGTVTEVEGELVQVEPHPGAKKVNYRVAVVKVSDRLLGAKGLTHVRVGFVPREDQPNDGLRIPTPVLDKGNEVCLFLRKFPGDGFYRIDGYLGAVGRRKTMPYMDDKFEAAADEAKKCAALLADPTASLQSKDADERMLTAWMLVIRCRAYPPGAKGLKEEPIDAGESRLILENLSRLAEKRGPEFSFAFAELGVGPADGWEGSVWADGGRERATRWVREHAATYRVKKYVAAAPAK